MLPRVRTAFRSSVQELKSVKSNLSLHSSVPTSQWTNFNARGNSSGEYAGCYTHGSTGDTEKHRAAQEQQNKSAPGLNMVLLIEPPQTPFCLAPPRQLV